MVNLMQNPMFSEASSLQSALKQAMQRLSTPLHERSIHVAVDISTEDLRSVCPGATRHAIDALLEVAIERSPIHGEVYVTACTTSRGLEVEIADSGDEVAFPIRRAFNPQDCRPLLQFPMINSGMHSSAGINIFGSACPQGGVAWTIVQRQRMYYTRVA